MNEERFVVSDMLWRRLEPHLPGKISVLGPLQRTIACFWKRSCGECAPGRRDATSHLLLQLEQPVPAVSKMGEIGHFRESFQRHE